MDSSCATSSKHSLVTYRHAQATRRLARWSQHRESSTAKRILLLYPCARVTATKSGDGSRHMMIILVSVNRWWNGTRLSVDIVSCPCRMPIALFAKMVWKKKFTNELYCFFNPSFSSRITKRAEQSLCCISLRSVY